MRPFFGVLDVVTASQILSSIKLFQRQRHADGLPPAARLAEFGRQLVSAYGGPAGTPLADPADVPEVGHMPEPRLLTYDEVAARTRLSERQVKRLVSQGVLPVVRINSAARVHSDDLNDYLEALRRKDPV